ncbi:MAG: hypothetical protein ACPLPW_08725 [bacterium]
MDKEEKLFDEIERDYLGPSPYSEPSFVYLNRSARPEFQRTRNLLEEWFQHFPSQAKRDFRERFRSEDDHHHYAAFFELYLFELFSRCGFSVEIHPEMDTKRTHPDFKVFKDGNPLFYLEAALAGISKEKKSAQKRKNKIIDAINKKIQSPNFFIGLEIHNISTQDPPKGVLCRFLEEKISNLDPDLIAEQFDKFELKGLPKWNWECGGWRITFYPIPKKVEARGKPGKRPIGCIHSGLHLVTPQIGIREAIKDKNSKYGELDLPFMVALNVLDEFKPDNIDIGNALFGEEIVTIIFRGNELIDQRPGRKPNGAWFGPKGPYNTRISAALIAVNLLPWNIARVTPVLWQNPWASRPLSPELLPFPKFLVGEDNHLEEFKGKNGWELLGLDPNWPEDK